MGAGLICLAMTRQRLDDLHIPLMVRESSNTARYGTAFTVSVDARDGITTGHLGLRPGIHRAGGH